MGLLGRSRRNVLDARHPLEVGVLRPERRAVRTCGGQDDGICHRNLQLDAHASSVQRERRGQVDRRASATGHRPNRQPSTLTLNWRSWAGRLHAVLGRALLDATLHEEGAILHVCVEDVVYPPVVQELAKLCGHGLLVNGCRLAKFYDLDAVCLVLHFLTG